MTRALCLDDFSAAQPGATATPVTQSTPGTEVDSDAALAAFEEGYRSGWEDSAKAEAEAHRRIAADLASALKDMSLTHAEARQDVLASLGPLFEQIAAQLLPSLAAEAVAPAVIAELRAVAADAATTRTVLTASPAALPALERLIGECGDLAVDLRAEPAYAEGQVSLRFDSGRRDIDLSDAARRMAGAIRAFVAHEIASPSAVTPLRKGAA